MLTIFALEPFCAEMTNTVAIALTIAATATSELRTNVSESGLSPKQIEEGWVRFVSLQPSVATEKWRTTTIERVERLSFYWAGRSNVVENVTQLSSNTVHLRLKQDWEVVPD